MEWRRGDLWITDEAEKIEKRKVAGWILATYWGKKRTEEMVLKSMENSLCFGLFSIEGQIGFARVISDFSTYAYLCDVIIEEGHRGKQLGEWLVGTIIKDERFRTARFALFTKDAQEFYRKKFGFKPHQFEALVREPVDQPASG